MPKGAPRLQAGWATMVNKRSGNNTFVRSYFSCMHHLEHIGIAVKSLEVSEPLFDKLLGTASYKREVVEDQHVITSFYRVGETKIELLESIAPDSPVARFIEKRGEGMHHIAFEVQDIHQEMERLKSAGFQLLQEKPSVGADNKWVCFLHPKTTNGVLIEICQSIPEGHAHRRHELEL